MGWFRQELGIRKEISTKDPVSKTRGVLHRDPKAYPASFPFPHSGIDTKGGDFFPISLLFITLIKK